MKTSRTGVMAYRIAAHAADVAKKISGAREQDDSVAKARKTKNKIST